jgi:hypothetical protein
MFNDLANYFVHNVIAAHKCYRSACSSSAGVYEHTRYAIEFATALFHFREHLPDPQKLSRIEVERRCPEYRLIADVANASKHQVITAPTPQGPSLVAKAEDIEEETTIVEYTDEDGSYRHACSQVIVACTDGMKRSLDQALIRVLNFWIAELKHLGVIDLDPAAEFVQPGAKFMTRDEASEELNLQITKGLNWSHRLRLLEFDNTTQSARPVDLTGARAEMRLYKPQYSVTLTLTPPDGSEPFEIDFQLTDEESVLYHRLKTDAEKSTFAQKVWHARQDEVAQKVRSLHQQRAEASKGPE